MDQDRLVNRMLLKCAVQLFTSVRPAPTMKDEVTSAVTAIDNTMHYGNAPPASGVGRLHKAEQLHGQKRFGLKCYKITTMQRGNQFFRQPVHQGRSPKIAPRNVLKLSRI